MVRACRGLSALLLVSILAACSSSPTIESDLGISGAPDWVNEGTQAVDNDDGRFVFGVAFAPPLNDESLQTSTADTRARAEVARMVSTYIDHTLDDYAASTGDTATSSIQQTLSSSTQTVLNGAKIKGRWKDKNSGNIYSFAEMDMKALDDAITTAGKLSQNFKQYYQQKANANFDRFMKETE
ncbi:hypothetical protein [Ketobacter sp.]|uniref:hypothetical protein n=1 Tax=Ketobacter sp. TaxID=2083498 RepID=UPI0025C22CC7|nr:hypothetical protein [Ketobacter sp.]